MDAVMYLVGALEKFDGMATPEIQKIAFEIGKLGQTGLDINSPDQKYRLRTLPGQFSGLHLVCLMYAGFKIINPSLDIGMDFAKEYQMAKTLHGKK